MAQFHTHVTVAAAASLTATAMLFQSGDFSRSEGIALFAFGLLGGILPDLDSDHARPTRLLFSLLALVAAVAVVLIGAGREPIWMLLLWAVGAVTVVRLLLYPLFAALTEHRGLFHSLPMALLIGLILLHLGSQAGWTVSFAWFAALFISGGYLVHLLLDELYSVDILGGSLKQSFGTALTLFSRRQWFGYMMLYGLVIVGYLAAPPFTEMRNPLTYVNLLINMRC